MKFKTIETISCPGSGEANEDALSADEHHLLVIDGATGVFNCNVTGEASDAKWLAQRGAEILGDYLETCVNPPIPMLCKQASLDIRREFLKFEPPSDLDTWPSAALGAIRLLENRLEYYCLGDVVILICLKDDTVKRISGDYRLNRANNKMLDKMVRLAEENGEHVSQQLDKIVNDLQATRKTRNTSEGYWIFDPIGVGAEKGTAGYLPTKNIDSVVVMSDGIADAFLTHAMEPDSKHFVERLERDGLEKVIKDFREIQDNDPFFDKYPRFKMHDDMTIVRAYL